jgi:hypothetical protein
MGLGQSRQKEQPPKKVNPQTEPILVASAEERSRTFSISPVDWSNKHYSEVITFLKEKYPTAHVTLHAEKNDGHLTFERPLSFEEGDIHIVIVYDAGTERIMGFYNGADPSG